MIYRVRHRTLYRYGDTVMVSHHLLHLTPRSTENQVRLDSRIGIEPQPLDEPVRRSDYYGNDIVIFDLDEPHDRFEVVATSLVSVTRPALPEAEETPPWEVVRERLQRGAEPGHHRVADFNARIEQSALVAELQDYVAPSFPEGRPLLEATEELSCRIHGDFDYDPSSTDVATPLATVLKQRSGVCQDFAHLMIAGLRAVGLPARYVSGYLLTRPPEGRERLVGADQSHAWVGVYVPDVGWVDLDPTNATRVGDEHVTLAWGRSYADVVPVKGVITGGGEHMLEVEVDVTPAPGPESPAGQTAGRDGAAPPGDSSQLVA